MVVHYENSVHESSWKLMHFSYFGSPERLTGKGKQGFNTVRQIICALYDEKNNKQKLTIGEIRQKTGLSKSVLSKHIKELVKQEVIRGTIEVRKSDKSERLEAVYEHNEKIMYKLKGKKVSVPEEAVRFYYDPEATGQEEYCCIAPGHLVGGSKGDTKKQEIITIIKKIADDKLETRKKDLEAKTVDKEENMRFYPDRPWDDPMFNANKTKVLGIMETLENNGIKESTLRLLSELIWYDGASESKLYQTLRIMEKLKREEKVERNQKTHTYSLKHNST